MPSSSQLNPAAVALAKSAWETILFPHDNRPGPNARLAQGAALRILAGIQSPGSGGPRSDADCQREIAALRQAELDFAFSRDYEPTGGGGEHLTFSAIVPDDLIYKATWREQFGFVPDWDGNDDLVLRPASPSEYLLRCGLANVVFGDDIQLMCIAQDQVGSSNVPSIVTSQPFIVGRPAETQEIVAYLEQLGFQSIRSRIHQASGLHDVWYRPDDQVMLCDAVAGNFVCTAEGIVAAIDLPMSLLPV